jgi:serine-type D-Ala-D-Ala carboxypeptidase/endopeptidase (penicillin-binding protein 4)
VGRRTGIAVMVLLPALIAGQAGHAGYAASTARAPVVLPAAKAEGTAPTTSGVQRALQQALRDPSLGRHAGVVVYDASRRKPLYGGNIANPFVPASTMKVLTTTAALASMGADHRFTTRVVSSGPSAITLVGGGDPLLASKRPKDPLTFPRRATLTDLAAATAKALKARGTRVVSLGYDASLFGGPAVNHRWQPTYISEDIVSPTTALWVDEGRVVPDRSKRSPDPARAAAVKFAALLQAFGVKVKATRPARAPAGAALVAEVRSASLGSIVEHVNLVSDNDGAEVLLRHIGLATKNGGSYAGGLKGLRSALTGLGLGSALGKARLEDGSGLSRTNAVPLTLLGQALLQAVDRPALRGVLTGLPVAGFTGTLDERFATVPGGSGVVRAKTGTLTGVHSLAGLVRSRSGTLLVFAAATDSAPATKPLQARAALDRIAGALASCGCP